MRYTTRRTHWMVGYAGGTGYADPRMLVRMTRDFALYGPWLHPTAGIEEGFRIDRESVEWVETSAGEIPIHFQYQFSAGRPRLIAFSVLYGLEPVANPVAAALRNPIDVLLNGSLPVTVSLVAGSIEEKRLPVLHARAVRWLTDAFEHFQAACSP